jgi:DnaJ homolog subfamily A member 5
MKNYVEPEWIRNTDEKFNGLNMGGDEELDSDDCNNVKNDDDDDNNDDYYDDDFFCVACDKSFKSDKAFKNHEKSKKHKENIDLLKKTMKEEDLNLILNKTDEIENEDEVEDADSEIKDEKPKNRYIN